MATRQLIILTVGVVCLAWGGLRIMKLFDHKRENGGLRPGFVRTWQCRTDGYVTNLTIAEVDRICAEGKVRLDPTNLAERLYECPKCRQMELQSVVLQVGRESHP
jgi:hypothetical protein